MKKKANKRKKKKKKKTKKTKTQKTKKTKKRLKTKTETNDPSRSRESLSCWLANCPFIDCWRWPALESVADGVTNRSITWSYFGRPLHSFDRENLALFLSLSLSLSLSLNLSVWSSYRVVFIFPDRRFIYLPPFHPQHASVGSFSRSFWLSTGLFFTEFPPDVQEFLLDRFD